MRFAKAMTMALGALGFLLLSTLASGQHMYRCGSNYQDSPCESGESKRIGSTGRSSNASTSSAASASDRVAEAECKSRGEASLKIVWSREAGLTLERQMQDAKTPTQRSLVASVYEKRGSAPVIRSQIEAECRDEQDRRKQVQALAAAAAQIKSTLPADPASESAGVSTQPAATATRTATTSSTETAHKATCARLAESLESLRNQQRNGGSAATMDRLSRERRNLESTLQSNGC